MFDRYHIGPRSMDVSVRGTITEQRAPTDESVRLLREMEKAARDSIEATFRLERNDGFAAVVIARHALLDDEIHLCALYDWKGEKRRVTAKYRPQLSENPNQVKGAALIELMNALAEDIARAVLEESFRKIKWEGV